MLSAMFQVFDITCVVLTALILFLGVILPAILWAAYGVCYLIDEGEKSFDYPNPRMLPWIDIVWEQNEELTVLFLALGGMLFGVLLAMHFDNAISLGVLYGWIIIVCAPTYGVYWLGRWWIRRKKRYQAVMDRLRGTR